MVAGTTALVRRTLRRALRSAALAAMLPGVVHAAAPACPPERQPPAADQVQQALAGAKDRGMLWRVSKGGRTSYLYGSIHLGALDRAFPGPRVIKALQGTDVLALELDLTDPKVQAGFVQAAAASGARARALPEALQTRLERQREAACVPTSTVAGQHPVLQVATITVEGARRDGLDAMWGQEIVLAGVAQAQHKPIVSLETVEGQMAALIPQDARDAESILDGALDQLESGEARQVLVRLYDSWAQGRLEDLADYERWCDCMKTAAERRFMRRLLEGRNPALAAGVDALHRQGRTVFAAIGALHMAGGQGLPALLARKGYSVERVF